MVQLDPIGSLSVQTSKTGIVLARLLLFILACGACAQSGVPADASEEVSGDGIRSHIDRLI